MLAERGPIRWWREPGEAVLDLSAEPRDWERGFCLHHTWRPSLRGARGKWVAYRVHRWHKVARGWRFGLGYHFLIEADGAVAVGPRWREQKNGAHARGLNRTTVGVALVGDFDSEAPTEAQLMALVGLLRELRALLPGWRERALGELTHYHHDVAPWKTCPGRWWWSRRERLLGAVATGSLGGLLEVRGA